MEKFIDNLLENIFSDSYFILNMRFSLILLVAGLILTKYFSNSEKKIKKYLFGFTPTILGLIGLCSNLIMAII